MGLLLAFPWLERVDRLWPELFKFEYAARCLEDIVDMMAANITRHQDTLDTNAPRDFIDMMLIEIQNTTDQVSVVEVVSDPARNRSNRVTFRLSRPGGDR